MQKHSEENLALAIGSLVRKLRKDRGYSQEEFADICGLNRTYIGFVERGERSIMVSSASRIASGLDMTLGQLFGRLDDEASRG